VVESDISRKVGWTSRADWMASSVAGSNFDACLPVGTPEGARLCSPFQNYRRSFGSCDNDRRRYVKTCSRECLADRCRMPWNGLKPLRTRIATTTFPWIDHLIPCAIWWWHVSWELNVTGHTVYNSLCFFLTGYHTIERLYTNVVPVCKQKPKAYTDFLRPHRRAIIAVTVNDARWQWEKCLCISWNYSLNLYLKQKFTGGSVHIQRHRELM
jgi:hypothetical protein